MDGSVIFFGHRCRGRHYFYRAFRKKKWCPSIFGSGDDEVSDKTRQIFKKKEHTEKKHPSKMMKNN